MDEKFNAILSVAIIPQVVDLISTKEGISDIDAMTSFYGSGTYEALSNESTKVWHFSPLTLYTMWKEETETGELIFPED